MEKWVCTTCGYIYNPTVGDPENGITPGSSFLAFPFTWRCPKCGAAKTDFERYEG